MPSREGWMNKGAPYVLEVLGYSTFPLPRNTIQWAVQTYAIDPPSKGSIYDGADLLVENGYAERVPTSGADHFQITDAGREYLDHEGGWIRFTDD